MKLGFVSDFYYPSIGGTQMLCKCIAEWFRDQGHEIEIITSPDSSRGNLDYIVNELNGASFQNSNILLEKNYDAVFVLADLFSPSLLSMKPGEVKKSILILNLDENVYRWIQEGKIKDIKQRIEKIKSFSHVVSFCQAAPVNKFLEENNIKYHFIPNFSRDVLASKSLNIDLKQKLNLGDKKIIFNHGNIEPRKNQLALIKSFLSSNLTEEYSLVLLGSPRTSADTRYLEALNDFLKKNDKNKNVVMLKGTNNMGLVDECLKQADLFVLPSLAEGLPLVLLEAMSADLPWVSTPCGGVPSVLGSLKSGVVLDNFDLTSKSLEEAILRLESSSSRCDWERDFTREKSCNKYMELLGK